MWYKMVDNFNNMGFEVKKTQAFYRLIGTTLGQILFF